MNKVVAERLKETAGSLSEDMYGEDRRGVRAEGGHNRLRELEETYRGYAV
jgi:hypothetical protein